ncbi:MAG TPA: hypothetical protein VGH48_06310 [Caldimonas sp.]
MAPGSLARLALGIGRTAAAASASGAAMAAPMVAGAASAAEGPAGSASMPAMVSAALTPGAPSSAPVAGTLDGRI